MGIHGASVSIGSAQPCIWETFWGITRTCHCEEQSDEAIQNLCYPLDCFAALAMTTSKPLFHDRISGRAEYNQRSLKSPQKGRLRALELFTSSVRPHFTPRSRR